MIDIPGARSKEKELVLFKFVFCAEVALALRPKYSHLQFYEHSRETPHDI